jgi:hypothetical protein
MLKKLIDLKVEKFKLCTVCLFVCLRVFVLVKNYYKIIIIVVILRESAYVYLYGLKSRVVTALLYCKGLAQTRNILLNTST